MAKVIVNKTEIGRIVWKLPTTDDVRGSAPPVAGGAGAIAHKHGSMVEFIPVERNGLDSSTVHSLLDELREYSITPTTFESRRYEESLQDLTYADTYSFGKTNVIRFGINTSAACLKIKPDAGESKRSGISSYSSKSGTKLLKAVEHIKHEMVEITVLQQAVKSLLDNVDTRAVLVDIIARDGGDLLIDKSSGSYETHSVVLYKNPANEDGKHSIAVIDPSNVAFSAHLGNPDIVGKFKPDRSNVILPKPEHERLFTKNGMPQVIIISKAREKIYQALATKEIGPAIDQCRDCIDIAVKLGLGFNNDTILALHLPITTSTELKKHPIICHITNNSEIDTNLPDSEEYGVCRIKQSSDFTKENLVGVFNSTMDACVKSAAALIPMDADNPLKIQYISALSKMDAAEELSAFCPEVILEARECLMGLVGEYVSGALNEMSSIMGEE